MPDVLHSLRSPSEIRKELAITLLCLQLQFDLKEHVRVCTLHAGTAFLNRLFQGLVTSSKYSLVGLGQLTSQLLIAFRVCYVTVLPWVSSTIISSGNSKVSSKFNVCSSMSIAI